MQRIGNPILDVPERLVSRGNSGSKDRSVDCADVSALAPGEKAGGVTVVVLLDGSGCRTEGRFSTVLQQGVDVAGTALSLGALERVHQGIAPEPRA